MHIKASNEPCINIFILLKLVCGAPNLWFKKRNIFSVMRDFRFSRRWKHGM